MVSIGVLGPAAVDDGADELTVVGSRRQRQLLAALVAAAGRPVSADALADAVWGDDLPADVAGAVQTTVSRLRRALPAGVSIHTGSGTYRLDVAADALDVTRFEHLVQRAVGAASSGERLADFDEALSLWRGDPFVDLDQPSVEAPRERLRELRADAAERRAATLLDLGRVDDAIAAASACREEGPLRERAVAVLMQALAAAGRQADALRVCADLRRRLADELGVDPTPELAALEGRILRQEMATAVVLAGGAPQPGRLPRAVGTSFGRGGDAERVGELLDRRRVVTLCGPGGVGKTRLALDVGTAVADRYDTACFVDLGAVNAADDVAAAVASHLGVQDRAGSTAEERIAEALAPHRALLVLDGVDQVVAGAARLVDRVVAGTPQVHLLATGRVPLGLAAEQRWPVGPLAVDDAVDLFLDRVDLVRPGWVPSSLERRLVTEMCRRLDGLPLAVELAAARLGTMTVAELDAALDDRLAVLSRRGGEGRHASLRAVVEWSVSQLADPARDLFDRLGVFAGSFTAAAAQAVCGDDGAGAPAGARAGASDGVPVGPSDGSAVAGTSAEVPVGPSTGSAMAGASAEAPVGPSGVGFVTAEVRDTLEELCERSLLAVDHGDDEARFVLLETMRVYALEELGAQGLRRAVEDRHARWAVALAEEADRGVRSVDEAQWSRVFETEMPELRRAQEHMAATGDVEGLLRLAEATTWWAWLGLRSEPLAWAARAAEVAEALDPDAPSLPLVTGRAAIGAWQRGDRHEAERLARRALEQAGADHPSGRVAEDVLGDLSTFAGDPVQAVGHFRRAERLSAAAGDECERILAVASISLAQTYGGDVEAGVAEGRRSLVDAEAAGVPSLLGWAEYALAEALAGTDPVVAEQHAARAVDLAEPSGTTFVTGVAGVTVTSLQARHGDAAAALARFPALIDLWHRAGAWTQLWTTLRSLIDALVRQGRARPAAILLGALRSSATAAPVYGADAERLAADEATLRAELGGDLDGALAEGTRLGDQEAVAFALRVLADDEA